MDPGSCLGEYGESSPGKETKARSPAVKNNLAGKNQGCFVSSNIQGDVEIHFHGEKPKSNSDKNLASVLKEYKCFIREAENTTLRTKLDQLQVGSKKYFLERKFKMGTECITYPELLKNIPKSKTSLVSGPSGSGKSTLAANLTLDWAESEDDSSYDLILYLSSLNTTSRLALHKFVWGEFADTLEDDCGQIYRELLDRKKKILVIIDGLGNN